MKPTQLEESFEIQCKDSFSRQRFHVTIEKQ